ncbi:hypothetical protein AAKU64_004417 [Undibacterium sp. GrIS 1.8]|uniref:hypothetical protein n=1 Tax=Undibacterium sp. GrIS 1.8 TaxID=3143934 RepID=UPI003399EDA5
MDHIECNSCHRQVIPRLWHYTPFLGQFRYATTQHICPLCGSCMYETGGQVKVTGWLLLAFIIYLFGVLLVQRVFPQFEIGVGSVIGLFFKVTVNGLVIYGLYKLVRYCMKKIGRGK